MPGRMCSSWSRTTRPLRSRDRDDGPVEAAVLPGRRRRAPGRARRTRRRRAREKPSMVAIRSAPMPCGTKPVVEVGHRVDGPGAAVGGHRHPRHRLDAAGEDQVLPARTDLGGGHVDGLQAGGTEAVLLDAGHGVRAARRRWRRSGRCRSPGRRRGPTTPSTMSSMAAGSRPGKRRADLVDQADDQVDRLGAVQGAVRLAAAARGADRVVDVRFGAHVSKPFERVRRSGDGAAGQPSRERPMISFMISVVPP